MEIITRQEAKAQGLRFYFTGKPCIRGHVSLRLVGPAFCRDCWRQRAKDWRDRNPERSKERVRAWHEAHPDYARRWSRENAEYVNEMSRKWYRENKARRIAADRAWRKANPEKAKAISDRYRARRSLSG